MLYLCFLPVYIAGNIYFLYEVDHFINAVAAVIKSDHRKKRFRITKIVFNVLYSFAALSLLMSFAISSEAAANSEFLFKLRRILKLIGNYHEGVLIYLITAFVVIGIVRFIRFLYLKISKKEPRVSDARRALIGLICMLFVLIISIYGVFHAKKIYREEFNVNIEKDAGDIEDLKVILIADLHMGYNIGSDYIEEAVSKINEEDADLIVIAGDIFDNEYEALDDPERLISALQSLKSKYGVYGVLGNHDIDEKILGGFTFGGKKNKQASDEMYEFVEKAGINILCEDYVLIGDEIYLYGRPDYERPGRYSLDGRKSPSEITEELDKDKPIIVLEHEPVELQELADAGVDMDLCGHTHDGQIFPLNLTSRYLTWENSAGLLKKDNMYSIVTSGLGLFGPNMRTGTDSEYCVINIHFDD